MIDFNEVFWAYVAMYDLHFGYDLVVHALARFRSGDVYRSNGTSQAR